MVACCTKSKTDQQLVRRLNGLKEIRHLIDRKSGLLIGLCNHAFHFISFSELIVGLSIFVFWITVTNDSINNALKAPALPGDGSRKSLQIEVIEIFS
jgi:hypothetical protein